MKNPETEERAATSEKTTIYFDLEARSKTPLPENLKATMLANTVMKDA